MSEQLSQTLGDEVYDYLNAGYPAIWVHSNEQEDGITELRDAIYGEDFPIFVRWDGAEGLKKWADQDGQAGWASVEDTQDLGAALLAIQAMATENMQGNEPVRVCAVFLNLQIHVTTPMRAQGLLNYIHRAETVLKQRFIVLSTVADPTPEILKGSFTPLSHNLPNREQLREVLTDVAIEDGDLPEEQQEVDAILDAARGMTRSQARNAFSLCLVREPNQVQAAPIFARKAKDLTDPNLGITLINDRETRIEHVVGMENAKSSIMEMIAGTREMQAVHPDLRAKGCLLVGLSGGGKTMLSKAIGNSCVPSRPTLVWKNALTGSKFVSEGASKMQQVINIMEALAPCNVQVDEGLKARLASAGGQEGGGSKVQAGEMDSLWLNYHEESTADVYPIFTANQEFIAVAKKEPEFIERFDEVFFIDYPTPQQLDNIWIYHMLKYQMIEHEDEFAEMKRRGDIPETNFWVGRNVKRCLVQAKLRKKLPVQCPTKKKDVVSSEVAEEMRDAAMKLGLMSAEYDDYYDKDHHQKLVAAAAVANGPRRDTVRPGKKRKKVVRSSA